MDEPIPKAACADPATRYKDRSVLLVFFGILTILLGCFAGLFVFMMLAGSARPGPNAAQQVPLSAMLPAISLYAVLAVALIWLGVGSILAQRWARALLLIFSWSWLIVGMIACAVMAMFMPTMLAEFSAIEVNGRPALPPEAIVPVIIVVSAMFGAVFLVLPGLWALVYGGRNVKATCEARNPAVSWTDACPLPVLGFSLWLALSVSTMLLSAVMGHRVIPFFGMFLTEWSASIFCVVFAAVWGYAAWSLYKRRLSGWWVVLIAFCVVTVSGVVTFSQHNFMEMYRLMDYPEAQMQEIEKLGLFKGNVMTYIMLFCMIPFFGYLLFLRKFIPRKA